MGQNFREQILRSSPTAPSTPNSQPPAHHRPGTSRAPPARLVRVGVGRPPPSSSRRRPSEVRGPTPSPRLPVAGSLPPARQGQVSGHPAPAPRLAGLAQAPSGLGQAASCPGQVVGCLASRFDLRPDGIGDDEGNASGGGHCARWLFDVLTQRRFAS